MHRKAKAFYRPNFTPPPECSIGEDIDEDEFYPDTSDDPECIVASLKLAECYQDKVEVVRTYEKIKKYLRTGADAGCPKAMFHLAQALRVSGEACTAEIQQLYTASYESGHMKASVRLAECKVFGLGLDKDLHAADRLLRKVDCHEPWAAFIRGVIYQSQFNAWENRHKAAGCFLISARGGVIRGMRRLAHTLLRDVQNDSSSKKQADYWWQKSLTELLRGWGGVSFSTNVSVIPEEIDTLKTLEYINSQHEFHACFRGYIGFDYGDSDLMRFVDEVVFEEITYFNESGGDWISELLRKRYLERLPKPFQFGVAVHQVACSFQDRENSWFDLDEGFQWHRIAAESGYKEAMFCIANIFLDQESKDYNVKEAFRWLIRAGEAGCVQSSLLLANCYLKGKGVPIDRVLAYRWANTAAANGVEKAIEMREMLSSVLIDSEIAEAQRLCRAGSHVAG